MIVPSDPSNVTSQGIYSRLRRLVLTAAYAKTPAQGQEPTVRFGILGAANIAPLALIRPAQYIPAIQIVAVAARNPDRAKEFAKAHKIPKVFSSYSELIKDPEINAVYIPTPNGYHFRYAMEALKAGKHVLCEKPLCANEQEANDLALAAKEANRLVMEASHSFHHPANLRAREIIRSKELGEVVKGSAINKIPPLCIPGKDIRYGIYGKDPKLAGGALMDAGVYAIHAIRFLTDGDVHDVTEAKLTLAYPQIDNDSEAKLTLKLRDGKFIPVEIGAALSAPFPWLSTPVTRVQCTNGSLVLKNFLLPSVWHRIDVYDASGKLARSEKHYDDGAASYQYCLQSFAKAVEQFNKDGIGGVAKTVSGGTVDDPVNTARAIDLIYLKGGLEIRKGDRGPY